MAAESDLGAIVRTCGEDYCRTHRTTARQRKALRAIGACRTPALGGHRQQCDRCGYEHIQWHSCRDRACPQCGGSARAAWLDQRQSELLPVPYFHVVFTVPEQLNPLALYATRLFYDLLFRAVGATLIEIGHSRLHAQLGVLAVLHTWSQTLLLHPHIHCVVPGGGFSDDGERWLSVRKANFFLPVKVLSRRFRTRLCALLREAWMSKELRVPKRVLPGTAAFNRLLADVRSREWVVYCKPPFAGPECVLRYLANYTHRIAISNSRILAFDGQHVTFRYRDSASGDVQKLMTLPVDEFLRRFLLHVVPSRFVRIRYYGFLGNRRRSENLVRARRLIGAPAPPLVTVAPPEAPLCPVCRVGLMRRLEDIPRQPSYLDSS